MKKIILLALTTLIMVGCAEKSAQPKELNTLNTYIGDSCEYVGWDVGSSYGILAHKGNCRFCAERKKQELKELVEQLKGK